MYRLVLTFETTSLLQVLLVLFDALGRSRRLRQMLGLGSCLGRDLLEMWQRSDRLLCSPTLAQLSYY